MMFEGIKVIAFDAFGTLLPGLLPLRRLPQRSTDGHGQ